MIGRGRPLRFLVLVLMGWSGMRVAMLWWQTGSLDTAVRNVAPVAALSASSPARPVVPASAPAPTPVASPPAAAWRLSEARPIPGKAASGPLAPNVYLAAPAPALPPVPARPGLANDGDAGRQQTILREPAFATRRAPPSAGNRIRGSAWLFLHGNSSTPAIGQGQLGGSQAGARLEYAVLPRAGVSAIARVAAPLRGRGSEVAAGLQWQPRGVPLRLIAEERIGIDGIESGPAVSAVTGSGPARVGGGFDLETYGEAGAVFRDRTNYYAAGAARLTRQVASVADHGVSVGAGVWASAQRGVARVDIGPSASVALPAGQANLRLSLDWRLRVAGDPQPGSGPALTLGADF